MRTFDRAKVGNRVWNLRHGWGTITEIEDKRIEVNLDNDYLQIEHFLFDGRIKSTDLNPSWFWNEIPITTPEKPKTTYVVKVEVRPFKLSTGHIFLDILDKSSSYLDWCGPIQYVDVEINDE